MARYATYPSTTTSPATRKWFFWALVLSLAIHGCFLLFAHLKRLDNFGFNNAAQIAPTRIVMKQVKIDPKLFEPPSEIKTQLDDKKPATLPTLDLPMEKPEIKDIQLSPQTNRDNQIPLPEEKPTVSPINWEDLKKTDAISAGSDDKKLNSLASTWIKESVAAPKQPAIRLPAGTTFGDSADGGSEGIPGRQSLEEAFARVGPLPAGDKMAMQGGALFDYDKAALRAEARDNLEMLGAIIRRNPGATFRIEGHTDAIGSRDYNLRLSQARADNMKAWLVQHLGIDPRRIETIGYGPDQLLAPADGTIDEQQPNRRVEIVIKTNRAP